MVAGVAPLVSGLPAWGDTALPGLDPAWSRWVEAPDAQGVPRRWHVLEHTGALEDAAPSEHGGRSEHSGLSEHPGLAGSDAGPRERGVLLCVHGNPTWSYLWRRVVAQVAPRWRVVAVDQLGMGWSQAPSGSSERPRTLAERIEDLTRLTDALGLSPGTAGRSGVPVVVAGHDWGGIVGAGWALRHRERGGALGGLILANTAVHHDFSRGLPAPLRPARALAGAVCVTTPTFVRAATALSRPALPRDVRDAYALPYARRADRGFVGQFVADIPLEADHPSRAAFEAIADGLARLGAASDVPALLLRGPRDPVFSEAHLRDLRRRLPGADVHRYEGAGHLVLDDAPRSATDIWAWIGRRVTVRDDSGARTQTQHPDRITVGDDNGPPTRTHDPDRITVGDDNGPPADTHNPDRTMARDDSGPPTDTRAARDARDTGVGGARNTGNNAPPAGAGLAGDTARSSPHARQEPERDPRLVVAAVPATAEPQSGPFVTDAPAPAWAALLDRARETPDDLAVAEVRSGRRMTFAELEDDVAATAAGLAARGVAPGDRVALLVPPGIDLTVAVYACWRIGAVVVVADTGLGLANVGRALRGAGTAHVIGIPAALAAVAALRVPGQRILAADTTVAAAGAARLLGAECTLDEVRAQGRGRPAPASPAPGADAAVLFTSGATGPSKGVVYRTEQLGVQARLIRSIYGLTSADRFVAAFAPFALYGPAMGVGSVVPDMDVTAPSTLTAAALADAVLAADATTVFASPASLRTVVATAGDLDAPRRAALAQVREAMSAGAPIPVAMLHAVAGVLPHARLHTPYGMTECLPVSDVTLEELDAVGRESGGGGGVCVGRPLPGVRVAIAPLPRDPRDADGPLTDRAGVTGEIVVSAQHVKDRYDQLWATQADSARDELAAADDVLGTGPRHRTGDVGHLDAAGRLWVEGRRVHVVHTPVGPLTPVALEQRVLGLPGVRDAAVVGVGPEGAQAVVVVVCPEPDADRAPERSGSTSPRSRRRAARPLVHRAAHLAARLDVRAVPPLADAELTARVRALAADTPGYAALADETRPGVAAVLVTAHFPVDIRHQSKVDRTQLARWADRVLAGGRVGRP